MLRTTLRHNMEGIFWHFKAVWHKNDYTSGKVTACPQIATALLEIQIASQFSYIRLVSNTLS